MKHLRRWIAETEGATSVEYAVMLALILSVCVLAIQFFGTTVGNSFAASADEIETYFPTGS